MSFPRYPSYRASGVEWLPDVPTHWTVASLKRFLRLQSGESITSEQIEVDGRFPVWGGNGVRGFTSSYTHEGSTVLIGRQGALCGNVNYASGCFWASEHAIVSTPLRPVNIKWLGEMLRAMDLNQYSVSAAQPGLSVDLIARLQTAIPPLEDQHAIGLFLDRETATINALVAEQERLIEVLKEKRQAVISHAVTKGLNPDAPMKPSGIEWLGNVPAHWRIARLAHYATVENGSTPDRERLDFWEDGAIPWVASGEVNQDRITEASALITTLALASCSVRLLPKGSIVVGLVGQGKTRGMAARLEIDATINQNLGAIVPGPELESDYVLFMFQAMYEYLREFGRGGNQAALNCEILSALRVPIPPQPEQHSIATYIGKQLARFNALTTDAERAVELLMERRAALVSAAVTGQIDVRRLAVSEDARRDASWQAM